MTKKYDEKEEFKEIIQRKNGEIEKLNLKVGTQLETIQFLEYNKTFLENRVNALLTAVTVLDRDRATFHKKLAYLKSKNIVDEHFNLIEDKIYLTT